MRSLMVCDDDMWSGLYIKMYILATESCINISSVVLLEVSVLPPPGLVTRYCLPWLTGYICAPICLVGHLHLHHRQNQQMQTLLQFPILHHSQSDCPLSSLSPSFSRGEQGEEWGDMSVERMLISQSIFWWLPVLGWHYVLQRKP